MVDKMVNRSISRLLFTKIKFTTEIDLSSSTDIPPVLNLFLSLHIYSQMKCTNILRWKVYFSVFHLNLLLNKTQERI